MTASSGGSSPSPRRTHRYYSTGPQTRCAAAACCARIAGKSITARPTAPSMMPAPGCCAGGGLRRRTSRCTFRLGVYTFRLCCRPLTGRPTTTSCGGSSTGSCRRSRPAPGSNMPAFRSCWTRQRCRRPAAAASATGSAPPCGLRPESSCAVTRWNNLRWATAYICCCAMAWAAARRPTGRRP